MRAPPPPPVILTAVSAFQRRGSAHFLRRPRTGKIATSVITRIYAAKDFCNTIGTFETCRLARNCPLKGADRRSQARGQNGANDPKLTLIDAPQQLSPPNLLPFKMTVARLPLGSEFSGVAAYGADFVLPTNFTILQSCWLS